MKDGRLPKTVLSSQPSRAKKIAGRLWWGWKDVIKKDIKGNGKFLGGCKDGGLGWRRSVCSCIGLR